MAKFGIAGEGITDQVVIENILCGFYKDYDDLDDEIRYTQPSTDDTDSKEQPPKGGWTRLFTYLGSELFLDDILNDNYMVIQVDTDVSEEIGFEVSRNCSTVELIEKVKERLILEMNKNNSAYINHKEKIIFAISVHSLECWILPLYVTKKGEMIHQCFEKLVKEVPKVSKKLKVNKNRNDYEKLSHDFLKHKKLMKIISQNSSLQIFINRLPKNI